ncbi:hypothetical protein HYH03_003245 [Edaphochlamys debaryana]|uniref:Uncharacterized protein n=1 Tax=Edaphochlamys debaryana TaxID=47281 RepID=A0A836C3Q6_9CHLO|nr:hypothetical protein HYH03_003245 [Edaphochlamys debaryana]|eukprot:KAG2499060.1 hypothetical protein HYH03_003245 [Edaphochlamys debaryana]
MVLDKDLPSRFLVAGHLFAVRWTRYASIMMGKDFRVNSPKNGIIWNSAIEHAYERQRICFSYSGLGSEFILHVLDKSLLEKKLSAVGQHKTDPDFVQALGDDTFESLQGKRVNFTGAEGKGPLKRALALHAKLALENCAKIYPADFDPRKFNFDDMSEHEGKEELMKLWLDELDTGSVAESGLNEAAAASADPEEAVNEEAVAEGP